MGGTTLPSEHDAADSLGAYLAAPRALPDEAGSGFIRRSVKRVLAEDLRGRLRVLATDALRPLERRKARRLTAARPVSLHLGSGHLPKEDWVNVDLVLGGPVDVAWNLRRTLPFADGSVRAIFHEHLLEHLDLSSALRLARECHRVLEPGGILRIGVPDAGAYARSYAAGGSGVIEAYRPGRPTAMLALQEVFYLHGHRTMYDDATLCLLLEEAGFRNVRARPSGESALEPAPDTPARAAESLYVEGVK